MSFRGVATEEAVLSPAEPEQSVLRCTGHLSESQGTCYQIYEPQEDVDCNPYIYNLDFPDPCSHSCTLRNANPFSSSRSLSTTLLHRWLA